MKAFFQRLGRSIMLPVAVLPAAAILAGIGNWILGFSADNLVGTFLLGAGTSILNNLAIIFAVGIAIGLSKDGHGAAALSGLTGFLVLTSLLSVGSVADLSGIDKSSVDEAFKDIDENVFMGIFSGIISSIMYNRFSDTKLPDALAFFSGKRLAPIMSAAAMVAGAAVMFFVWPVVYSWLVSFGTAISNLGAAGAGLYGFFNRLLIPTGLHHALNSVFWFDTIGIDDIGKFLKGSTGDGIKGITGRYQAGFYPIMMFGLPAAALAMYHTAKPSRKNTTKSLMLAAGFASFLTGVTEPLEFSFMFLAPALYVVHALLTGISLFIAAFFEWISGFGFSAGFVDYTLQFFNPLASQPYMLLVQGLVFGVLYYFLFRFLIVKLNLKTPGREDLPESVEGEEEGDKTVNEGESNSSEDRFAVMGAQIYEGLGEDDNIRSVDYCTTRLRVEVEDMDKVDQDKIKATNVPGVHVIGSHNIQVIVGTSVQFVADEVNKLRK